MEFTCSIETVFLRLSTSADLPLAGEEISNVLGVHSQNYDCFFTDIRYLRATERVLGTFCGPAQTMPGLVRLTPPLKLSPEETRLLLENGAACLMTVSTDEEVLPDEKMRALELYQKKLLEKSVSRSFS